MRKIFIILLLILLFGCTSHRWNNVSIQELNCDGEVTKTWHNVKILATNHNWVRFKTSKRQITINTNYRIIYPED